MTEGCNCSEVGSALLPAITVVSRALPFLMVTFRRNEFQVLEKLWETDISKEQWKDAQLSALFS